MKAYKRTGINILCIVLMLIAFAKPIEVKAYDNSYVALQSEDYSAETECFTDYDALCEYIREQLKARNETITISVSAELSEYYNSVYDIYYDAMAYKKGNSSDEGDTLQNEIRSSSTTIRDYGTYIKFITTMTYYTDSNQEKELHAAIKQTVSDMKLDGMSDYSKVRQIYDFVCNHVDYDYEHMGDTTYFLKQTAYAAMFNKTSVCQGYTVLFYRMCIEAGVECRIIPGIANGGAHSWNIVKIGDYWYNVDSTWDGQGVNTTHKWFLLNDSEFPDHVREDRYLSDEFYREYPMAADSWTDYSEGLTLPNYDNIPLCNYNTVDGTVVNNQANGRKKVLIFYRNSCTNSQNTIKSLRDNIPQGVDIIAIDIDTSSKENVAEFRDTYGSDKISFVYSIDGYAYNSLNAFEYDELFGSGNSIYLPYIVYIDANNKVQYRTMSATNAASIQKILDEYCSGEVKWQVKAEEKLNIGDTSRVEIWRNDVKKNEQFFAWESSDASVASIDANGNITALSGGSTIIKCKVNDVVVAQTKLTVITSGITGLQYVDGKWQYFTNGTVDTEFVGLVEMNGYSWYVKNGTIDMEYAGLFYYNNEWSFIRKGKVDTSRNGLVYNKGNWWYIQNGKLPTDFIGIVENENGKWYIRYGKLDSERSGLVYINGVWWYLNNGKVNESFEGLLAYNNIWWYIKDGQIQTSYTGLVANQYGWWYVKAGKIDFTYTGIAANANGSWYVKSGKIDFTYTGNYTDTTGSYNIVNGKVVK